MNPKPVEIPGWSTLRWWCAVLGIFALQTGGLLFCSRRGLDSITPASPTPRVYFLTSPLPYPRVAEVLALQDPFVFTRVQATDFFDPKWLQQARPHSPIPANQAPSRMLEPPSESLGNDFRNYVATTAPPSGLKTEKAPPPIAVLSLPSTITPSNALLRIEGELAERRMVSTPATPRNESLTLLTNTILRVAVDRHGETLLATVLAPSGSPASDRSALEFARLARFEPMRTNSGSHALSRSSGLTFGQMIFQWFPIDPPGTNPPASKP